MYKGTCNAWNTQQPTKSKMVARGPKNNRCGLKRGLLLDIWALMSTVANKFFDSSTPFMRKVDEGGEKGGREWKNNVGNSSHLHCYQSTTQTMTDCNTNHFTYITLAPSSSLFPPSILKNMQPSSLL